jgi:hypothetical protein
MQDLLLLFEMEGLQILCTCIYKIAIEKPIGHYLSQKFELYYDIVLNHHLVDICSDTMLNNHFSQELS